LVSLLIASYKILQFCIEGVERWVGSRDLLVRSQAD